MESYGFRDSDTVFMDIRSALLTTGRHTYKLHTFCDLGGAVAGLNQNVPALGTQRGRDSLCKRLNTVEQSGTSFHSELEILLHAQY